MNELSLFNSLFDDVFGTTTMYRSAAPKVDVTEEEKGYTLEMELPGRCENDVNIELDHDNLKIASKKEEKSDDKTAKYILRERRLSDFERSFALPKDVDTENITANFKNGILTVFMQKKPEAAPKKIAIQAC